MQVWVYGAFALAVVVVAMSWPEGYVKYKIKHEGYDQYIGKKLTEVVPLGGPIKGTITGCKTTCTATANCAAFTVPRTKNSKYSNKGRMCQLLAKPPCATATPFSCTTADGTRVQRIEKLMTKDATSALYVSRSWRKEVMTQPAKFDTSSLPAVPVAPIVPPAPADPAPMVAGEGMVR